MKIITAIFSAIAEVFKWWNAGKKLRDRNNQIEDDEELAENIRNGSEQEIAEEWKRRQY